MNDSGSDNFGFRRPPSTRPAGWASRGHDMVAGRLALDGAVLTGDPFAGPQPAGDAAMAELHGFGWLDDLAAVGSPIARGLAQSRVLGWLRRYPDGPPAAPGADVIWSPQVTGRRIRAWVAHAGTLLPGLDRAASLPVFRSLHAQMAHVARHAPAAPPGAPRIEAWAGLAIAAMSLRHAQGHIAPALQGLAEAAPAALGAGRNPEALLDLIALLAWTVALAAEDPGGTPLPEGLARTIAAAQPILRALRHDDGTLVRAHGGGSGAPGRLDRILHGAWATGAGVPDGITLGFGHLSRGGATLICDMAPPPPGPLAHAGTLGFEFTAGGQPLIVACGSGRRLSDAWGQAGRASAAHSTLVLDGRSSARSGPDGTLHPETRVSGAETARDPDGTGHLRASHEGWRASHGLDHRRTLSLLPDGLALRGTDVLHPAGTAAPHAGLPFALHFHLHPDTDATLTPGHDAVILTVLDGTVWRFDHDGAATLSLEPSVRLEPANNQPVSSRQIVLRAATERAPRPIRWRLARLG